MSPSATVSYRNIRFFNGIRCLCCVWIVFTHTIAFTAVFPWSTCGMTYIREFPVIGYFALSMNAVDVFWILSGFLCEYQLRYKVDKTKSFWSLWFMINRLLRLYPLYLLNILIIVLSPMNIRCDTNTKIFRAIFFMEMLNWNDDTRDVIPPPCTYSGWSINTDVHGYIVIVLISVMVTSNKYKKFIMWFLYIMSCILTFIIIFQYNISWPVWLWSLQNFDPDGLSKTFELNPNSKEQYQNPLDFYPEFDPMIPEFVQYRTRSFNWLYHIYFTSILKHGASMFLGVILAINFKVNNKKKHNIYCIWLNILKIIIGFLLLYIVMDLRMDIKYRSSIWTFAYHKVFILAVYIQFDAILCISQFKNNILSRIINKALSNKVWNLLLPYLYGIYLFHLLPLGSIVNILSVYPSDVVNGGIGQDNYGYIYNITICSKTMAISFIIAFCLYWLVEYPINLFRYKHIQPKYIKNKLKIK